MTTKVEPVQFWMESLIPKGGITILYGKFGTYKTPITINMGIAMAQGKELWGLSTTKAKVLYIEADTPDNVLRPRIQSTNFAIEGFDFYWAYPGFNAVIPTGSAYDLAIHTELVQAHTKESYDVIMVDSLRCIHNLDDTKSDAPPKIYQSVAKMFPGASLVFIHHDKKTPVFKNATEDEKAEIDIESFSGSQALVNHATVGIKIRHANKEKKLVQLVHAKSQASELISPLLLKVRDAIHVGLPDELNSDSYRKALTMVPRGLSLGEQDKKVAEFLGVSERTARRYRESL